MISKHEVTPSHGNKLKDPTCYSCGWVGHYSNDPQCPNFGQPRMGAIQEEHDHEAVVNKPVDHAETDDPSMDPISDKAVDTTQDVDKVPELSDRGIDEDPLVGSQYTSKGEDYPLETYEEYSDYSDGEQIMVICESHLQTDADGAFPVVVEESNTKSSEPDDGDDIKQWIQSIHIQQDAGQTAKQTTTVVHK